MEGMVIYRLRNYKHFLTQQSMIHTYHHLQKISGNRTIDGPVSFVEIYKNFQPLRMKLPNMALFFV
jgi:hypothetical protein